MVADDARDVHAVACLLGCGADAVCPQLALETVAADADASEDSDLVSPEAQERFQAAVEDGVLKIMSKMGIATVDSYRGAQIFEAIGLGPEVVDDLLHRHAVGDRRRRLGRAGRRRPRPPRVGRLAATKPRPS